MKNPDKKQPKKIHSKPDILTYFLYRFENIAWVERVNRIVRIKQTKSNISSEATESLIAHFVIDGIIKLPFVVKLVERWGHIKHKNGGSDVIVNKRYRIESKGAASKDGFTSASYGNLDSDMIVYMNFNKGPANVVVWIANPKDISLEHIPGNNESKMRLGKIFRILDKEGKCIKFDFNVIKYLKSEPQNMLFS